MGLAKLQTQSLNTLVSWNECMQGSQHTSSPCSMESYYASCDLRHTHLMNCFCVMIFSSPGMATSDMLYGALQRGTLDYMAPELLSALECESHSDQPLRLQSQHPITTAVDVYSFGLVLWQIITGESLDRAAGALRQPRCALFCRCSMEISEAMLIHACTTGHGESQHPAVRFPRGETCALRRQEHEHQAFNVAVEARRTVDLCSSIDREALCRVPEECPETVWTLCQACLEGDPTQRPSSADIAKEIAAAVAGHRPCF